MDILTLWYCFCFANVVYYPQSCILYCFSLGSYEVTEAEGVQRGTKVVVHLKGDSYDFAKEEMIKGKEQEHYNQHNVC